jgi:Zn-dependent peptidase ImmA (M78 family)
MNAGVADGSSMSNRGWDFEHLKALALEKRKQFRVETHAFGLREIRTIYGQERIKIDPWKLPSKIKAVYMCDDGHCSVAIQPKLPKEPRLFALIHELKHHFCDQETILTGAVHCGDYNANKLIEIGAEVFAAEFIYPEEEFRNHVLARGVSIWTPEDIVRFKRDCKAIVSYTFVRKRLVRLGLIGPDQFLKIQFQKLEDQMYGAPIYRQPWFRERLRLKR